MQRQDRPEDDAALNPVGTDPDLVAFVEGLETMGRGQDPPGRDQGATAAGSHHGEIRVVGNVCRSPVDDRPGLNGKPEPEGDGSDSEDPDHPRSAARWGRRISRSQVGGHRPEDVIGEVLAAIDNWHPETARADEGDRDLSFGEPGDVAHVPVEIRVLPPPSVGHDDPLGEVERVVARTQFRSVPLDDVPAGLRGKCAARKSPLCQPGHVVDRSGGEHSVAESPGR